jgi:molecular chaperone DnaK (HSP70)
MKIELSQFSSIEHDIYFDEVDCAIMSCFTKQWKTSNIELLNRDISLAHQLLKKTSTNPDEIFISILVRDTSFISKTQNILEDIFHKEASKEIEPKKQ